MKLFVFGSSLTSSYWNGAATYYRGIYKNLHRLGYEISFAEPDIYGRQQKRDAGVVDYAEVQVYRSPADLDRMLAEACSAELIIKHSGVGADDEFLEAMVPQCRSNWRKVAFWDVDAPATLARVEANPDDRFRAQIPNYDYIFSYGGGPAVTQHYLRLGARNCIPIYNALDPETHYPVAGDPNLTCDLLFVGHRLPDRERRVREFFFKTAELASDMKFLLRGEGWSDCPLPKNVRWLGHIGIADHNRANSSARMVLNVNRQSMADVGFSPPTRVFEAAGAAACVITDLWAGVDHFFAPGLEILVVSSAKEIVSLLREVTPQHASATGKAMRERALRDHTYELRALQFDAALRRTSTDSGLVTGAPGLASVGRPGNLWCGDRCGN
jgi:spore maturation protein CgeB